MVRQADWHSLPAEVQGRILAEIDDEERCTIIPILSKEMHELHRAQAPARKRWDVDRSITKPMVEWGSLISGSLGELNLTSRCPFQIRELTLKRCFAPGAWAAPDDHPFSNLARLHSLEVMNLDCLYDQNAFPALDLKSWEAIALCTALAKLAKLRTVTISMDEISLFLDGLLPALPTLTQISHLEIGRGGEKFHYILEDAAVGMADLGRLSQLTSLVIKFKLPPIDYEPIFALPNLRKLRFHVACGHGSKNFMPWHVASANLTDLEAVGGPFDLVNKAKTINPHYPPFYDIEWSWRWTACLSPRCECCNLHRELFGVDTYTDESA